MVEVKRIGYHDRKEIERSLEEGASLVDISYRIDVDPTAISREIKRNRSAQPDVSKSRFRPITCERFGDCTARGLCSARCKRLCRSCQSKRCEELCPRFREFDCRRTSRYPHVCNGCRLLNRCPKERFVYRARSAHKKALARASESRAGIDVDAAGLARASRIVAPLLRKGQSVKAILASHPEVGMSPTTLYRRIADGSISGATNMDLPRKVRFKVRRRKSPKGRQRVDYTGRDHGAFMLLPEGFRSLCKEMDTVIGRPGGKCLLTFCLRDVHVFYARLMDGKTAASVKSALDDVEMAAADGGLLGELGVTVVLTDRGPEFDRFEDIERSCLCPGSGDRRCEVYYCDPYSSWQKPWVENAHTLLRRVLPKGSSFDSLTQDDIDLVCSHINSYPREELGWRTPFEMLPDWGRENIPPAFGMREVPRDEVNLTPSLLGGARIDK